MVLLMFSLDISNSLIAAPENCSFVPQSRLFFLTCVKEASINADTLSTGRFLLPAAAVPSAGNQQALIRSDLLSGLLRVKLS